MLATGPTLSRSGQGPGMCISTRTAPGAEAPWSGNFTLRTKHLNIYLDVVEFKFIGYYNLGALFFLILKK